MRDTARELDAVLQYSYYISEIWSLGLELQHKLANKLNLYRLFLVSISLR